MKSWLFTVGLTNEHQHPEAELHSMINPLNKWN